MVVTGISLAMRWQCLLYIYDDYLEWDWVGFGNEIVYRIGWESGELA